MNELCSRFSNKSRNIIKNKFTIIHQGRTNKPVFQLPFFLFLQLPLTLWKCSKTKNYCWLCALQLLLKRISDLWNHNLSLGSSQDWRTSRLSSANNAVRNLNPFLYGRPYKISTGNEAISHPPASLSHFSKSGFNLHMFLKLRFKASKREMVVWLKSFPYSLPIASPTSPCTETQKGAGGRARRESSHQQWQPSLHRPP